MTLLGRVAFVVFLLAVAVGAAWAFAVGLDREDRRMEIQQQQQVVVSR